MVILEDKFVGEVVKRITMAHLVQMPMSPKRIQFPKNVRIWVWFWALVYLDSNQGGPLMLEVRDEEMAQIEWVGSGEIMIGSKPKAIKNNLKEMRDRDGGGPRSSFEYPDDDAVEVEEVSMKSKVKNHKWKKKVNERREKKLVD